MPNLPKRRKSKNNPYKLGYDEEKEKYTLTFKDSKNNIQIIEITEQLYKVFNLFELEDLSEMNEYDNHIEHSELYEETLYKRTFNKEISVEEYVEKKLLMKQLYDYIEELPSIQKKRLKKYFIEQKSYEQIALEEGCTKRAIKFSVDIAIQKISKKFKN